MMMVGELLDEMVEQLFHWEPARYPVRNHEPRVQLDGRLWHLIHERDGGVCWICERTVAKGEGEIDHLIPRSSFEPHEVVTVADRSWNLRLACVDCNQDKSNFTVRVLPRTFGITRACWWCATDKRDGESVELTMPAYCGRCGVTSWVPGEEWLL